MMMEIVPSPYKRKQIDGNEQRRKQDNALKAFKN
jgi:hypothetical protein